MLQEACSYEEMILARIIVAQGCCLGPLKLRQSSLGFADGINPREAKQEEKRLRPETKGQTFEKTRPAFLAKQRRERKSAAMLSQIDYHPKRANRASGRPAVTAPYVLMTLKLRQTFETHCGSPAWCGGCGLLVSPRSTGGWPLRQSIVGFVHRQSDLSDHG